MVWLFLRCLFNAQNGVSMVKYTAANQTATGAVVSGTTQLTVTNGYDVYTGLQAGNKINIIAIIVLIGFVNSASNVTAAGLITLA